MVGWLDHPAAAGKQEATMRLGPRSLLVFFSAISVGSFAAGCGDDGGNKDSNPPAADGGGDGGGGEGGAKCKTKLDASLIRCHFGTISSGGSVVVGSAGATDPNAEITISGKNDTTTTTAGDDGSFARAFIAGNGETITVTATAPGCDPTSVTVTCTLGQ